MGIEPARQAQVSDAYTLPVGAGVFHSASSRVAVCRNPSGGPCIFYLGL